eukprot:COSAG01_NODE_733_length_13988_cov_1136.208150_2_plen_121_part_00
MPQDSKPVCTQDSDSGAWRGTCCQKCPVPSDSKGPDDQCVDCSDIGSSVNEYGQPTGDHGIMKPRIMAGFEESLTGKLSSLPDPSPVPTSMRKPVELNLFRCPFLVRRCIQSVDRLDTLC